MERVFKKACHSCGVSWSKTKKKTNLKILKAQKTLKKKRVMKKLPPEKKTGRKISANSNNIGRFPAAQTDYKKLRQGYVHIPQQSSFWRAELFHQVGPLDDNVYFAMDYDLWRRLAKVSELKYHRRTWANFRLHASAKTIAEDDRCWPEMVEIHKRDGGSSFSVIVAKYYLRRVLAPLVTWRRRRRVKQAAEK